MSVKRQWIHRAKGSCLKHEMMKYEMALQVIIRVAKCVCKGNPYIYD